MNKIISTCALALAVAASACAAPGEESAPTVSQGTEPTASAKPKPAAKKAGPRAKPEQPGNIAKFDQKINFPNGVTVWVTGVDTVRGGEFSDAPGKSITVLTVRVQNKAKQPLSNVSFAEPRLTYGRGGQKAEPAHDYEKVPNDADQHNASILSGRSATVQMPFDLPRSARSDVVLEFEIWYGPDMDSESLTAIFNGPLPKVS